MAGADTPSVAVVTPAIILIVTAAAAVVDWWSRATGRDSVETWAKPLTTIGVIGLALVSGAPSGQVTWTTIALVLCLVGDVALLPRVDRFVVGLAAFLLGHLAFIGAFVARGIDQPTLTGVGFVAAGLLIATVGMVVVRGATAHDRSLRTPVLAYLVVISAMAAIGWGTGEAVVIAGTTAFVVSDSVLGWRQFVRPVRHGALVVMVTYHLAIGSLALSLW